MVNFQFDSVVYLSENDLSKLQKEVKRMDDLKENSGVFVTQKVTHGELICEIGNETLKRNSLKKESFYFLFIDSKDNFVVDSRTSTTCAKHIRRSCRPNVTIKSVVCGDKTSWFLFAEGMIKKDSELFLSSDYKNGNFGYRRECSCGNQETCVFETANQQKKKKTTEVSFKEYLKMNRI